MSSNSKCIALLKNKNTQCKNKHLVESIFCGVHKKSHPNFVCINIKSEDSFNKRDNNHIWKLINFKSIEYTTNEINIERQKIIQDLINEQSKLESEKILLEKKQTEELNKVNKCSVCYDEYEHNDLIKCNRTTYEKQHFCCKNCLRGHIDSLYSDGIASLDCMFNNSDKCGGSYCEKQILNIIDENMIEKWKETLSISEILKLASICDDYIICPLCCKWGCIFEIPPGIRENFYIKCGKCLLDWCNICKRKAHGNRNCNQLVFEEDEPIEKRIEIIDRLLQDIINKALTHCCTSCGTVFQKDFGCNLIQCPKCDGLTCYLCKKKLFIKNGSKYTHFKNHDLSDPDAICELWNDKVGSLTPTNGNKEYDQNKLKDAIINFVFSNNIENAKLIINRFENLYKDDIDYKNFIQEMKGMFME
jgi:hypothetical protein